MCVCFCLMIYILTNAMYMRTELYATLYYCLLLSWAWRRHISLGFSLITTVGGWPLAFFACLINECQLGLFVVTISLNQCLVVGKGRKEPLASVASTRTKKEKMIPSITHLSFSRKYLCDGRGEDVTLLAEALCVCAPADTHWSRM